MQKFLAAMQLYTLFSKPPSGGNLGSQSIRATARCDFRSRCCRLPMTKEEFKDLFLRNVEQAMAVARRVATLPLHPDFDIELHGAGEIGRITPLDRVIDLMYLGEDTFYPIIDIGVKAVF